MGDEKPGAETQRLDGAGDRTADAAVDRHYLIVFEGERSQMFALPRTGHVVLGRGEATDLRIDDVAVSRQHVRITLDEGQARVADLDSQNGTLLDGEPLVGERALEPGATLTVGGAALVFCSSGRPTGTRRALPADQFRHRLEEETERCLGYQRAVCVVAVAFPSPVDRVRLDPVLHRFLRKMDAWSWSGRSELVLLLPETDAEAARAASTSLLEAFGPAGAASRAGFASCPTDGSDPDTLLLGARAAAARAEPGRAVSAAEAFRTLTVGDVTVLVADPAMVRICALAERLAVSGLPVLVCGETGSGKELLASAVHHFSPRAKGPYLTLNCAALQDTLVESELFGHERGAFSGAVAARAGLLERAHGGTVFLDEVGELSAAAQGKLLRALETQRVTRLGDSKERQLDLRIVAATNRNLADEVAAGRFRQDLLYRLNAATLWVPPLRERRREILLLAHAFLRQACARAGRPTLVISDAVMHLLSQHSWPGNVRELRNVIEYAAATVSEDSIEPWHLRDRLGPSLLDSAKDEPKGVSRRSLGEELRDLERRRMTAALAETGGNQTRAAELLGMPLRSFVRKLKQHGLEA